MVYLMILIGMVAAVWAGCLSLLGTSGVSVAMLFTLFTAVVLSFEIYNDFRTHPE